MSVARALSLSPLPLSHLHRLRLLWALPRASVHAFPSTISAAAATRRVCARAFSSSTHAGSSGLSGTTRSIIKPNTAPNQLHNSHQRLAKKQSIRRSNQNSRHGISPKAVDLIEKVLMLPDVKEVIYKELDKWAASEGKFPIAYVKQAMQVFEREENWSKVIQGSTQRWDPNYICQGWMLSISQASLLNWLAGVIPQFQAGMPKGMVWVSEWLVQKEEGQTLRTFEVFLKALDMHQCPEEAEAVWKNDILKKAWSIPTKLVAYVLNMFERHHKPIEIIKLFTLMEGKGRKLDKMSMKKVARAYEEAGFLEMKTQMLLKYNIVDQEFVDNSKALQS